MQLQGEECVRLCLAKKACGRSDIPLIRYDRRDVGKSVLRAVRDIRHFDCAEGTREVHRNLLDTMVCRQPSLKLY